jgi:hypothetical protein
MASGPAIDEQVYERYSKPLEEKIRAISLLGPQFLTAIRSAETAGCAPALLHDAIQLGSALSGNPGEGALEVYRDLDKNLRQTQAFIARWREEACPGPRRLVSVAQRICEALAEMTALVESTPPEVMRAIKAAVRQVRYLRASEEERHDFNGSNVVMIASFAIVLLLKFLEVLDLSWYLVIPIGVGAAVLAAALVSTIRFSRCG